MYVGTLGTSDETASLLMTVVLGVAVLVVLLDIVDDAMDKVVVAVVTCALFFGDGVAFEGMQLACVAVCPG
eukprot:1960285-Ditylum_brightwellii.AAC.2